jgi:hypothetical protein
MPFPRGHGGSNGGSAKCNCTEVLMSAYILHWQLTRPGVCVDCGRSVTQMGYRAIEADTLLCVDCFELRARKGEVWNMGEAPEHGY